MAYLGRGIENLSDRVVLDSLTASATASYTLQLNSVNFVPSSASSLTVSLNGVIQKPDSSYTVSGSTLTFSSALTSSDSIDFIIAERGITLQTPSAGSVNTDQLAANAVNNSKIASDAAIATTKLGSGAVLNVYTNVNTTADSTTSTSFVASSSAITLTPVSSSSKFLLLFNSVLEVTNGCRPEFTFFRDSTNIGVGHNNSIVRDQDTSNINVSYGMHKVDTPSTSSQIVYKMFFRSSNGNQAFAVSGGEANFTIMEIAG